jgi:hypothetical protein
LSEYIPPPEVQQEQSRRWELVRSGRPYHHWHTNRDEPPPTEHWCRFCVGFFGVPHSDEFHNIHDKECREVGKALSGRRNCACIECHVAERKAKARA